MVFLSRKKEAQEIKKAIEGQEPTDMPPMPESPAIPIPAPPRQQPQAAPLFVKIDRYNEVLAKLEKSKEEIKSLAALLTLLMSIEETRKSTEVTIKNHIASLTDILISLDEEFVQPQEAEGLVREKREVKSDVERYVNDLQRELKNLRSELSKIG
ncbi:MAG: hypothetical protein HZB68_03950 [Candidatus Aenigmarchaeota archaeon]|nr:hypothetical protein [Candidatus Aenigmarchaeota archaeon]